LVKIKVKIKDGTTCYVRFLKPLKSNLYRNRNNKQLKKDQLEAQWSNFRN